MKKIKTTPPIHFVHHALVNPLHPVAITLIGAGGTGSQVLTALARINQSLLQLRHPGLQVALFDDDRVTVPNLGRMLFAPSEIGLWKTAALINRVNRFFGTNWKGVAKKFDNNSDTQLPIRTQIAISCTDTVQSRFDIEKILCASVNQQSPSPHPLYWMDFGNSHHTGQVILSTIGVIQQPASKKFTPIEKLPMITAEFPHLLRADPSEDIPSCSLAEALHKQDLFINSTLANVGASLLWSMFREGMIRHRGCFLHLRDFQLQPIALK